MSQLATASRRLNSIDPDTAPSLTPPTRELQLGYEALNAFFDRIVVITLRRATPRHEAMARALEGLRYDIHYGQDKRELDLADLAARGIYDPARARRLHRLGREMSTGEVACALSHMALWRQIVSGPHQRVLVLEDDAMPVPGALSSAGQALSDLPASWQLVYLGYARGERLTLRHRLKRLSYMALGAVGLHYLSPREAARLLPRPYSPHLRRAGLHDQTHAYGITPAGAEGLLRCLEPVALSVDTGITRVVLRGELEAYITAEKLFVQAGGDSYIRAPDPLRMLDVSRAEEARRVAACERS